MKEGGKRPLNKVENGAIDSVSLGMFEKHIDTQVHTHTNIHTVSYMRYTHALFCLIYRKVA